MLVALRWVAMRVRVRLGALPTFVSMSMVPVVNMVVVMGHRFMKVIELERVTRRPQHQSGGRRDQGQHSEGGERGR